MGPRPPDGARAEDAYLVGVDGLQSRDDPVHVGQGGSRAIASDDGVVALSHSQVDVAHTDLRKV